MGTTALIMFEDGRGRAVYVSRGHDGNPGTVAADIAYVLDTWGGKWSGAEVGLLVSIFLGEMWRRQSVDAASFWPTARVAAEGCYLPRLADYTIEFQDGDGQLRDDAKYLFHVFFDRSVFDRSGGKWVAREVDALPLPRFVPLDMRKPRWR